MSTIVWLEKNYIFLDQPIKLEKIDKHFYTDFFFFSSQKTETTSLTCLMKNWSEFHLIMFMVWIKKKKKELGVNLLRQGVLLTQ